MGLIYLVGAASALFVIGLGVDHFRCAFGWHPVEGRRMRPGERSRGPHGQIMAEQVAVWECGRCNQTADETRLYVNPTTQVTLRRQVPSARARSKIIEFHVVRRPDDEVKTA